MDLISHFAVARQQQLLDQAARHRQTRRRPRSLRALVPAGRRPAAPVGAQPAPCATC